MHLVCNFYQGLSSVIHTYYQSQELSLSGHIHDCEIQKSINHLITERATSNDENVESGEPTSETHWRWDTICLELAFYWFNLKYHFS